MRDRDVLTDDIARERLLSRHGAGAAYAQLAEEIASAAEAYETRCALIRETEELQQQRNTLSRTIGERKRAGEDTSALQEEVQTLKDELERVKNACATAEETYTQYMLRIPNVPDATVPVGADESANTVIRVWGDLPEYAYEPQHHSDLGAALGILDLPRAAKMSGARFSFLRGAGARLERALSAFMLDVHTEQHGYTECVPPYIVTGETMQGTGQLPKFTDDLFRLDWTREMYLIPTAEVPLTSMHTGEILEQKDLPLKYTACTPCFRSEAGAHGKDTRGIMRVHQFTKVELVNIVAPETSYKALEEMTQAAERILQLLEIPYRVVLLCTGDMGFASAKTYDIEVWLPGQQRYREISSCSNCTDFQARRMNMRYRPDGGKPTYVHTLNGSGVAVGRAWLALIENYQQEDGSVRIPTVLRPYMGGCTCLTPTDE